MQTGRMVVITGAAGGVGSILVDRFLRNGDTVLGTDTRADTLKEWRQRWTVDAKLITAAADISQENDCAELAKVVGDHAGHVDVLVNCAGYFPFQLFEQMSADQWRKVIDINLTGTFLMCKAMVPLMKGRGCGRIVSFGSGSVFQGTAGQSHYVAAKAGLVGFSRSLARELGDEGITVNVVTPGVTVTKAASDSFPAEMLKQQHTQRALQRDEQPEDLAGQSGTDLVVCGWRPESVPVRRTAPGVGGPPPGCTEATGATSSTRGARGRSPGSGALVHHEDRAVLRRHGRQHRRAIIAARIRSPCLEQATPQETRAVGVA